MNHALIFRSNGRPRSLSTTCTPYIGGRCRILTEKSCSPHDFMNAVRCKKNTKHYLKERSHRYCFYPVRDANLRIYKYSLLFVLGFRWGKDWSFQVEVFFLSSVRARVLYDTIVPLFCSLSLNRSFWRHQSAAVQFLTFSFFEAILLKNVLLWRWKNLTEISNWESQRSTSQYYYWLDTLHNTILKSILRILWNPIQLRWARRVNKIKHEPAPEGDFRHNHSISFLTPVIFY